MIEYVLRKFYFNKYSKNDQDIFLLLKYEIILHAFLGVMCCLTALLPVISLIISMYLVKNFIFAISVIIYEVLYIILFLAISFKFKDKIYDFSEKYSSKLYFYLLTMNGKAITRKGFKKIRALDIDLYNKIYTQSCSGFCYYTCFSILKILKKGAIQYYRIRAFEHEELENKYTMHVVYVNNGFVYDVYSSRQYKLNKFLKKFQADLLYKEFLYEDIKTKCFEEFMDYNYKSMNEWCKENDCYCCT